MRILVDELPVMASDCIFFCQKDCVINGKECVRMQKEHNETDEDCPFLKEFKPFQFEPEFKAIFKEK